MTLDQQIETLIREAPQDGTTPALVSAIAPVLKSFAEQLQHTEYYVLQNLSENWLSTTLQQNEPEAKFKTVVYAYATLKDASSGYSYVKDPELMALPVPVIDILFRLNGMEGIDSTIFFDQASSAHPGVEVNRADLNQSIQNYLTMITQPPSSLPPDIA